MVTVPEMVDSNIPRTGEGGTSDFAVTGSRRNALGAIPGLLLLSPQPNAT